MTPSQKRAITAIGRRLNIDPTAVARQRFGVVVQSLSVDQASQLIEELNRLPTPDCRQLADH